jgi:hypothetical protein
MRSKLVTNVALDTMAAGQPYFPGSQLLVLNFTAGALVLQESDTAGGSYTTVVNQPTGPVVGAVGVSEFIVQKQFLKVSTAANLFLVGN